MQIRSSHPCGSVPTPVTSKRIKKDALKWFRNNDVTAQDLVEPSLLALSNLARVPLIETTKRTPKDGNQ
jgi:hypothetical protein